MKVRKNHEKLNYLRVAMVCLLFRKLELKREEGGSGWDRRDGVKEETGRVL